MVTAKAVAGGLLSGVGSGMVAQDEIRREEAERKRQEALERAREQRKREFTRERDRTQHERILERQEARQEHSGGLLSRTLTDEEGRVHGVTRGMETRDLGIRVGQDEEGSGGLLGGGEGGGIDNAQLNTLERISRNFWSTMNEQGQFMLPEDSQEKYVETLSRAESMVMAGMPAGRAANIAALSIAGPLDEQEAREQAIKEAGSEGVDTPGWFDGGDTEWIDRRTQEIMQESREAERLYNQTVGGGQQGQGRRSGQRPQARSGQRASGAPPGQGTRNDPYKATTQAQIDWFLENAPAGAVIEANGRLFTK